MNQKHNGLKFPCCAQGLTAQGEKCLALKRKHTLGFIPTNLGQGVSWFGLATGWASFALLMSSLVKPPTPKGKIFGVSSSLYEMGKRRQRQATVWWAPKLCSFPNRFIVVDFASQSSSQSVIKYRGIMNSRDGSPSPVLWSSMLLLLRLHREA